MKNTPSSIRSLFSSNRIVATCVLLGLLAAPARAVDRHVPSVGFPTIADAVAVAQQGDRILVGPGTYQENIVSTVANLQFIGRAAVWDGTLANGTPGVCLTVTGDGTVVQGFSFRAGQANVAQVQLTGSGCRVLKCSSRGPSTRFLKITGNTAVVDACSMFAVDSTAIEIIGDGATVKKVKTRQCDDNVIRIQGSGAVVTGCNMALNEDGNSISIVGNESLVSLNVFLNCDGIISISGTNATVVKNKSVQNGGTFLGITGPGAFVQNNSAFYCVGSFVSVNGSNAVVANNRATYCGGNFVSVNGDNAVVEKNFGVVAGAFSVTGDFVTVRGNSVADAPNDKGGISVSSRTATGGGLVENNKTKNSASTGLNINCNNVVVRGNRVTGAGTENGESACRVAGDGNHLTNNVVIGGGTHGFDVSGASNTLVKCTAIDAAADGFHIGGDGNTLLICDAMLCTGEGLDNGGAGTTVIDCAFKKNRLDVANDGTFTNAGTFTTDNSFVTGGPTQAPQVD